MTELQAGCAAVNATQPTSVSISAPVVALSACALRGLAENNVTGVGSVATGCANIVAGAHDTVTVRTYTK